MGCFVAVVCLLLFSCYCFLAVVLLLLFCCCCFVAVVLLLLLIYFCFLFCLASSNNRCWATTSSAGTLAFSKRCWATVNWISAGLNSKNNLKSFNFVGFFKRCLAALFQRRSSPEVVGQTSFCKRKSLKKPGTFDRGSGAKSCRHDARTAHHICRYRRPQPSTSTIGGTNTQTWTRKASDCNTFARGESESSGA